MNLIKLLIWWFLKRAGINRGDINLNSRRGALHRSWGHVFSNHLDGDYVEFGVYKGDSLIDSIETYLGFRKWLSSQLISIEPWRVNVAEQSPLNKKMTFHGLDTFSGMPENSEDNFIYGKGTFVGDKKSVETKVRIHLSDSVEIELYEGLFLETKVALQNKLLGKKAAIINIDCDIKESTSDSLQIIENYLQVGSIVLFDDYNAFCANNQLGQRRALSDFNKHTRFVFEKFFTYHFSGQAFLIVDIKS